MVLDEEWLNLIRTRSGNDLDRALAIALRESATLRATLRAEREELIKAWVKLRRRLPYCELVLWVRL